VLDEPTGSQDDEPSVAPYRAASLDASTWPDFAALAERHNGVWGGCWCLAFHPEGGERGVDHRAAKEARVRDGRAHAALVYDDDVCVGWCQYGPPSELPRIKFGRAYRAEAARPPDWRITCFFVDTKHRRAGVAAAALDAALQQIAALGGGRVESSPEDVTDRTTSSSFLYNGTLALFESRGFHRVRPLGKHAWLVASDVPARVT